MEGSSHNSPSSTDCPRTCARSVEGSRCATCRLTASGFHARERPSIDRVAAADSADPNWAWGRKESLDSPTDLVWHRGVRRGFPTVTTDFPRTNRTGEIANRDPPADFVCRSHSERRPGRSLRSRPIGDRLRLSGRSLGRPQLRSFSFQNLDPPKARPASRPFLVSV